MRRTMFEAGFSSPTHAYGIVPPAEQGAVRLGSPQLGTLTPLRPELGGPQVGSLWGDIKNIFQGKVAPVAPPPPPVPAPSGTVLGIPTSYVLIGGGVMLVLGVMAALIGGKKNGPAPVPPKPSVGRRRRY